MKDVFPLVFAEQRLHGLRFSDYRRYRAHCASRIRNLRRSLGLQQAKNRRYKAVPLPDVPKDARVLEIRIFEAERCWASAQELLVAAANSDRPGVGQLRHHAQRRLARAVRHATALVQAVQNVTFDCAFTEAQCRAYLQALKADWYALRKEPVAANEALDVATRILRNCRTQHPLETAYTQRLDALEVLRKSMNLPKAEISVEETHDLQQVISKDMETVRSFLGRHHKFKGGFEAAERLEKLLDLIGNSAALDRVTDVKRLFIARSFAAGARYQEAYACVRRVQLHADVDERLFPEFPAALQRCRLTVGAEILKTIGPLPEAAAAGEAAMEVAEGLEEEKGEEEVGESKPAGVKGLVGKVTSWFGGRG